MYDNQDKITLFTYLTQEKEGVMKAIGAVAGVALFPEFEERQAIITEHLNAAFNGIQELLKEVENLPVSGTK